MKEFSPETLEKIWKIKSKIEKQLFNLKEKFNFLHFYKEDTSYTVNTKKFIYGFYLDYDNFLIPGEFTVLINTRLNVSLSFSICNSSKLKDLNLFGNIFTPEYRRKKIIEEEFQNISINVNPINLSGKIENHFLFGVRDTVNDVREGFVIYEGFSHFDKGFDKFRLTMEDQISIYKPDFLINQMTSLRKFHAAIVPRLFELNNKMNLLGLEPLTLNNTTLNDVNMQYEDNRRNNTTLFRYIFTAKSRDDNLLDQLSLKNLLIKKFRTYDLDGTIFTTEYAHSMLITINIGENKFYF